MIRLLPKRHQTKIRRIGMMSLGLFTIAHGASAQSYPLQGVQALQPTGLFGGLGQIFGLPSGGSDPGRVALESQKILDQIRRLEYLQRYDEALEQCEKGLALIRQMPMAGLNLQLFGNTGQEFSNAKIRLLVKSGGHDPADVLFRQEIDATSKSLAAGLPIAASSAVTTFDEYIQSLAFADKTEKAEGAIAYVLTRFEKVIDNDPILAQRFYLRSGDVAYQLGQRDKALGRYQQAWKGALEVARLETNNGMRSGGFAAIQAMLGELTNTASSLLTGLYDDFDIDPAQMPYDPNSAIGKMGVSGSKQSLPATILRNLMITAQDLGRTDLVVDLYQADLREFAALQVKSAGELMKNGPASNMATAMTSSSQGMVALYLAFGQALEASGKDHLAIDAYQEALTRSQVGLDQISTGYGSPRAARRLYSAAITAMGRLLNITGATANPDTQSRLAVEVGLLKGSIHDRLLLVNHMPYEVGEANASELRRSMQASYEQVVTHWGESRSLNSEHFANYAEKKLELTKLGGEWLKQAVARRFDRSALHQASAGLQRGTAFLDYFLAEDRHGTAKYSVFVHRHGKSTQLVGLGNAEVVDKLIGQLRQDILDVNESRIEATANKLGEMIWAPIVPLIAGAEKVTVSPDGPMLLLPFDVIRHNGKYLLDQVTISTANSLRDLLPTKETTPVQATASVLVGDPDFGQSSVEINKQRQLNFEQLPGTRSEVQQIAQMLKSNGQPTKIWLGKDASLANVRSVRSPRFLHLASHGFFYDEPKGRFEWVPGSDMRRDGQSLTTNRSGIPTTGIALERANVVSPSMSMLTADKVSGIDLRGTELVVLSACDTGLGQLKSGEGVRGMRTSFLVAGAKRVVASLWYLPDTAASSLMGSFYQHVLVGIPADVALRKAKQDLKKQNQNPFYWGALGITSGAN